MVNKLKLPIWLLSLSSLLLLGACSKWHEDAARDDREAPTLILLAPHRSDFLPGDTIPISLEVLENDELHDVYIGLNNLSDMRKVLHYGIHLHAQQLRIDTFYRLPLQEGTAHYELQIEASDHRGNQNELRQPIFVYPAP